MQNLPWDIDIVDGSKVIDAKSLCGVLGLDLSKTFTVRAIGLDVDIDKVLEPWKVGEG